MNNERKCRRTCFVKRVWREMNGGMQKQLGSA